MKNHRIQKILRNLNTIFDINFLSKITDEQENYEFFITDISLKNYKSFCLWSIRFGILFDMEDCISLLSRQKSDRGIK